MFLILQLPPPVESFQLHQLHALIIVICGTSGTSGYYLYFHIHLTIIHNLSVSLSVSIFAISSQTFWPTRLIFSGSYGGFCGVVWIKFSED